MEALEAALTEYVGALVDRKAITSEPVERAFRKVRRHRFLEGWYHPDVTDGRVVLLPVEYDRDRPSPEDIKEIYSNQALVTAIHLSVPTSSTSQPSLVAGMLELLDLRSGMRALEIGTGTGYNAALLAEILGSAADVFTIEFQEDVARRARDYLADEGYGDVQVVCGDGFFGVPEAAPFDRIVATVGCPDLSPHWLAQLDGSGFLLIPLQHGLSDPLARLRRDPDFPTQALGRIVDTSGFMQIQGALTWATPWRNSLIVGLPERPTWSRRLPDALTSTAEPGHPLGQAHHRAFAFFLSLALRPLWYTNDGYGLADPGAASVVVVTREAIEGYSATPFGKSLDALYESFLGLLDLWIDLATPVPSDFELHFVPKSEFDHSKRLEGTPGRQWIIERPFFWEIVRLP
jgi:protein-L-isoaspartate(D-aspartate) O-methyltransferase